MGLFSKMAKMAAVVAGFAVVNSFAVSVSNPIMYVDSPDPSIVRVDDAYYMVTTTMHFAPGVPIFKSTDLAQWRTVGYAYETLTNNNKMNLNGDDAYGKGSWASSIRYHKGFFYVLTPSYTTNKTHLYKTADVENGPWSEVQLPFYHDPSLFFDDDGTVWVFYGSGDQISYVQLNDDASGVKAGGKSGKVGGVSVNSVTHASNYYVQQEGSHMEKVNGEYYLFTISWPAGACRTEIVYRSKSLLSGFSGRIFLQDNGVAQGGIFDTPDGQWYALLFRDSGPVGRMSHLVPMVWKDGWPEPTGGTKKAPSTIDLPESPLPGYGMVTSDDFDSEVLPLEWQWNHNPDNKNWSLSANPGFFRITTSRTDSRIVSAKNTLTQRAFGPKSSGRTLVDGKGMKDGDFAGLVALQDDKGFVALTKDGGSYKVVMYSGSEKGEAQKASVPLSDSKVYLRVDFDLPIDRGTASFYYSTDGSEWKKIGDNVSLSYSLHMFVGYRWGLFNFATKTAGGYADFDWFKVGVDANDEIYLDGAGSEPVPQTPFCAAGENCPAASIPGKIEAENFDVPGKGKDGSSYYDGDSENHGDSDYRKGTGVDLYEKATGVIVGYNSEGDWLEYTVNVKETGEYTMFAAVAAAGSTSSFKLSLDGKDITEEISVPAASSGEDNYDEYNKVKANVTLPEGEHVLRFTVVGSWLDIDYFTFVKGANATDPEETIGFTKGIRHNVQGVQSYSVYGLDGKFVGRVNASNSFDVRNKVNSLVKESGVYVVKSLTTGTTHRLSVTK
jgi:beta-xylosidase